jgi:hypothetical protein
MIAVLEEAAVVVTVLATLELPLEVITRTSCFNPVELMLALLEGCILAVAIVAVMRKRYE